MKYFSRRRPEGQSVGHAGQRLGRGHDEFGERAYHIDSLLTAACHRRRLKYFTDVHRDRPYERDDEHRAVQTVQQISISSHFLLKNLDFESSHDELF